MARLEDVFSIIRNGASIKQTVGAGGFPITRIETISNRQVDRNKFGYAGIKDIDKYREYVLQDGDILMSHINSEKHLGKVALYKKQGDEKIIHGMNLLMLRANETLVYPPFATYYFETNMFLNQIQRITKKSVNQASFTVTALKEIEMPLPPLEEQRRIATLLDKVSDLIAKRRAQLDKLDLLVKSRFVEMFGDPIINPMNWDKKTLKEICTKLTDGTHFSPESFETGDFKYVTAKNIKENGFDFSTITYVTEEVHRSIYERCNPEFGDILYIKDGVTTGVAMINTLKEEFSLLSSVALLKQNRSMIDGYFLWGVLNNKEMYTNIRSNMGGAAITRLTIAKLNKIQIILPPINLQKQFASYSQQIEKIKFSINHSLDKLETLKKALMQQYFG